MKNFTPNIKHASELTHDELLACKELIASGGAVQNNNHLLSLMKMGHVFAVYLNASNPVSIAALKVPNTHYTQSVFAKAHVDNANEFLFELGWVVTDQAHRNKHLAKELCQALISTVSTPIYCTVHESNIAMQRIVFSLGFVAVGQTFSSIVNENEQVGLYIKC